MKTLKSIIQGLHPGWWIVLLDLKDAYLHVPIHPSHWQYLWFALRNPPAALVYPWKVLPFGLATAPRVFTKLLAPIVGHLHLQGCLMYPFIDDMLSPLSCLALLPPDMSHSRHQCPLSLHAGVHCQSHKVGPCSLSGGSPLTSHDRHGQEYSLSLPCQAGDDCARSSGTALSHPGVSWTASSGDRSTGVLPFLSSAVYV